MADGKGAATGTGSGLGKRPALSRRDVVLGAGGVAALFALGGVGVALAGDGDLLRPPGGQDEALFIGACLKCDKCRSICPEGCISVTRIEQGLVNYRTPRIDFRKGSCTFCNECIAVCPTEALSAFDPEKDKIGVAVVVPEQCIAYTTAGCRVCADACEYGAVTIDGNGKPQVDAGLCNGCGKCELKCPSGSLTAFSGSSKRGINVERWEA